MNLACNRRTHQDHILGYIARNIPNYIAQVILMELVVRPKADIFVADRVLGERLKGRYFALSKLVQEAGVGRPEETNVRDRVQDHSNPLEAKAKCPGDAIVDALHNIQYLRTRVEMDSPPRSSVGSLTTPQPRISNHFPWNQTSTS